MNKEYRVDTFSRGKEFIHEENFFDTKDEALVFAGKEVAKGKQVFLLQHIIDGVYNVVEEIR